MFIELRQPVQAALVFGVTVVKFLSLNIKRSCGGTCLAFVKPEGVSIINRPVSILDN